MRRSTLPFMLWLAVLLVACGAPATRLGPTSAGNTTAGDASIDAEPSRGDPNAPVTLIEYGDYQ